MEDRDLKQTVRAIESAKSIYFMGIAGTGMASVAGLCHDAGFAVSGSDQAIYPPMSTLLESLNIDVKTPYSPTNLGEKKPDVIVVANALSRGHEELESAIASHIPLTSFPEILRHKFLNDRQPIVVTGTHGKTTTTSIVVHILKHLQLDPGYMVGGVVKEWSRSFDIGSKPFFVIEGDEYDTAFFDKGPKFLHYAPQFAAINAIEFDHADIYSGLEPIMANFSKLIAIMKNPKNIVANIDDENICKLLQEHKILDQVTSVACYGRNADSSISVLDSEPDKSSPTPLWKTTLQFDQKETCSVSSSMMGRYNSANIAIAVALVKNATEANGKEWSETLPRVIRALESFSGVHRRLEHLGHISGIDVYEDFAHHPTAVNHIIETMKAWQPERRLLVAFEPKNATGRRNIFQDEYIRVLEKADGIYIGACAVDKRIPERERMDTSEIARSIGPNAKAFGSNDDLLASIAAEARGDDIVIFMSSGSFGNCQRRLVDQLGNRTKI